MDLDFGYGAVNNGNDVNTANENNVESNTTNLNNGSIENNPNGVPADDVNEQTDSEQHEEQKLENKQEQQTEQDIILEAGSSLEIGDEKYTVDDKGNVLDANGNIYKEAKDVQEWIKSFDKVDETDDSNTISSFAVGGMANELETRFDCYMPPFFHTMIGEIKMWAGNEIPRGWLLCDGDEVSKTKFPKLYEAIGDLWGTPASSSNFMLPNLNGKVPVGYNSTDTDFDTVGKVGGEKTHTLSDTEMPSHNHGGNGTGKRLLQYNYSETDGVSERSVASASGNYKAPVVNNANTDWTDTDYTGNTGGGGAHNNLQPYAVIKYIICAI